MALPVESTLTPSISFPHSDLGAGSGASLLSGHCRHGVDLGGKQCPLDGPRDIRAVMAGERSS